MIIKTACPEEKLLNILIKFLALYRTVDRELFLKSTGED